MLTSKSMQKKSDDCTLVELCERLAYRASVPSNEFLDNKFSKTDRKNLLILLLKEESEGA